jgi:ribosomal protein S18 acetylase RimI-like enzyme
MTGVSIKSAQRSEIRAARSVLSAAYSQYEAMFPAENWGPYLADILDVEGRFAVSELLIAERNGVVVGCVSFYPPGARTSYPSKTFSEHWPQEWAAIRLLAVAPSARGRGIGRALTKVCIERSVAAGAPAIGLHTTKEMAVARSMYERMGFERAPAYDFHPAPTILVEAYRLLLSASDGLLL